ncbi:GH12 family glycosyl hydrolase domain-containing protein [Streptomyces sp. TRM68367]|uniref:GH12 family glycosyl hydrolase domain-containing protein n=1 Tax=Streptomyces sp. TRM68367 TaxID=2758415 RepID=UPI00165CDCC2|nr:endo-1,4-beta-glucanase [Streptomyces sp. TRM68367]MBC9728030.1 endo-1,4-beta-glucanase [Streptomyces sp. TRM68367]
MRTPAPARSSPHRRRRLGRPAKCLLASGVALAAAASLGVANAGTESGDSGAGARAEVCDAFGTIALGKYYVNNNLWGQDNGSGRQCVWDTAHSGDTIGWGTEYTWSGTDNEVKSFASAVLGWHWGWKADQAATGLPVSVGDHKDVTTSWDFDVSAAAGTMNVAYDLWLHTKSDVDWRDQPSDEVMVWLNRQGGAGPLGEKVATVNLGGASWDLYEGDIGWKVHSFVRTDNTTSADLDLDDFLGELVRRGLLSDTKYLTGVEAGTEVFTGTGRVDTRAYSVDVG